MSWLGGKCLRLVENLDNREQEKYMTNTRLFKMVNEIFKPQYNENLLSLQYCILKREKVLKSERDA